MKLRNKSPFKSLHLAVFAATLASITLAPIITQQLDAAQAAPVNAKSADSFVDSIGVNTHLTYGGTPYERFEDVKFKLQDAGIRHIRDGGHNEDDYINKLKELAAVGVKSELIFHGTAPDQVLEVLKKAGGAVSAAEGPNESDLEMMGFSYNGEKFPEGTRKYQEVLFNAIKGDGATKHLPVVLPSMGWGEDADKMGYIGNYGDFCNMHSYPNGGNKPTHDIDWYFIPHAQNMCGTDKQMMVTETGYNNAVNDREDGSGISENASSKYLSRMFLENFNRNIKRTFTYELYDESPEGDRESNWGLIRYDGSVKPAYTAIKNMTSLLKEPGANFQPGSLDYSLSVGNDQVHSTLLQKSKGEFYLILWQDANSYNTDNKEDVKVNDLNVKVTLNSSVSRAEVYKPKDSGSAILVQDAPSGGSLSDVTVAVPDHPVIIKLVPNGVSNSGGGSDNSGGGSNNSGGGSDNSGGGSDNSGGGSDNSGGGSDNSGGGSDNSGGSQSDQVMVYRKRDFGGKSQGFSVSPGVYNASKGDFNIVADDMISAIRVPKGLVAYVCDDDTQQQCRIFEAGDYAYVGDDINNKISYMEVLPAE